MKTLSILVFILLSAPLICQSPLAIVYAIDLVKTAEGFRALVYIDTLGYPTIGYGHKLTKDEIGKLKEVTEPQAEQLL